MGSYNLHASILVIIAHFCCALTAAGTKGLSLSCRTLLLRLLMTFYEWEALCRGIYIRFDVCYCRLACNPMSFTHEHNYSATGIKLTEY
jgi:hypothetical protein